MGVNDPRLRPKTDAKYVVRVLNLSTGKYEYVSPNMYKDVAKMHHLDVLAEHSAKDAEGLNLFSTELVTGKYDFLTGKPINKRSSMYHSTDLPLLNPWGIPVDGRVIASSGYWGPMPMTHGCPPTDFCDVCGKEDYVTQMLRYYPPPQTGMPGLFINVQKCLKHDPPVRSPLAVTPNGALFASLVFLDRQGVEILTYQDDLLASAGKKIPTLGPFSRCNLRCMDGMTGALVKMRVQPDAERGVDRNANPYKEWRKGAKNRWWLGWRKP